METVYWKTTRKQRKGPLVVNDHSIINEFIGTYATTQHAVSLNAQSSVVAQYTALLILAVVFIISL